MLKKPKIDATKLGELFKNEAGVERVETSTK